MKFITQVTEKRINEMVQSHHRYGEALQSLLDNMKAREGWLGTSIKEMSYYGVRLDNDTQIRVSEYYAPLYNGITCAYHKIFYASFTLGLNVANIYDFNKLVKIMSELPCNGWTTLC